MNISIIIPTFNSAKNINTNLDSIKSQTYKDYQLVIIDNNSSDETIEIIKKKNFSNIKFLIENDKGIFDAINKGIELCDNEIVSILHSDDFYNDENVLNNVINVFVENKFNDIVYGNLIYVKQNDISYNLRYWKPGNFKNNSFFKGWHPPHPSFFIKKKIYKQYGSYELKHGNSSDVELMFRLLTIHGVQSQYLNKTLVKMRYGGASNRNILSIIKQNLKILKFLKINLNPYKILKFFLFKFADRLKQFVIRK